MSIRYVAPIKDKDLQSLCGRFNSFANLLLQILVHRDQKLVLVHHISYGVFHISSNFAGDFLAPCREIKNGYDGITSQNDSDRPVVFPHVVLVGPAANLLQALGRSFWVETFIKRVDHDYDSFSKGYLR